MNHRSLLSSILSRNVLLCRFALFSQRCKQTPLLRVPVEVYLYEGQFINRRGTYFSDHFCNSSRSQPASCHCLYVNEFNYEILILSEDMQAC